MEEEQDTDDEDIEAQIRRELEGLQPSKEKPRRFQPVQLDMPCGMSAMMNPKAPSAYALGLQVLHWYIGANNPWQ